MTLIKNKPAFAVSASRVRGARKRGGVLWTLLEGMLDLALLLLCKRSAAQLPGWM